METEERPTKIRKLETSTGTVQDGVLSNDNSNSEDPIQVTTENPSESQAVTMEIAQGEGNDSGEDQASELPVPEETAPAVSTVLDNAGDPPLSKSKLKKLRKKAEWEAKRPERKAIKKEKLQAKRERKRKEKRQEAEVNPEAVKEPKTSLPPRQATQLPITILIDCDFDELMLDGERISLATQVTRSYSDNKSSPYRAHLTVCSFGGELRKRFDNILSHYKNWKGLRTFDCDFVDVAEKAREWMDGPEGGKLAGVFSQYAGLDEEARTNLKEEGEVVYLTSEANEDLTELKPYSTYIIGGLVDKNREKGICYKRAMRRNVRTAKLPIGEFLNMSSRKVLATNHVNEIMLRWLECGDWGEAFIKVIPKRKGGTLKGPEDEVKQTPEKVEEGEESDE